MQVNLTLFKAKLYLFIAMAKVSWVSMDIEPKLMAPLKMQLKESYFKLPFLSTTFHLFSK